MARISALFGLLLGLVACGDTSPPGGTSASGTAASGTAPGAPAPGERDGAPEPVVLRVGHFPNVTHAHGLIAHALTRQGKGWFEERLRGVTIEWFTYNAGPSAMEAILSGTLDLTYVGPNPALNAHIKSRGEEVRVLAGATNGGAALVVPADGRLDAPEAFRGKRVATPQLGNTQDVACRAWLAGHGFQVTQTGGDVAVVPTSNPDQLALFQSGDVDAVWTVEPWVSRLEREAGGKVLVEESDALTTVLAASAAFVRDHRDLAARFVAAHGELTDWIIAHPEEAQALVAAELGAEMQSEVKPDLIAHCWPRLHFTSLVSLAPLQEFLKAAQTVGFLKDAGDISRLVEPDLAPKGKAAGSP
jgi:NitT/TauT family transport system substrate-binding protein